MKTTIKTPKWTLTIHEGEEGPRHDPTEYVEFWWERPGKPVWKLHEGLGCRLALNDIDYTAKTGEECVELSDAFWEMVGLSPATLDRALRRLGKGIYGEHELVFF